MLQTHLITNSNNSQDHTPTRITSIISGFKWRLYHAYTLFSNHTRIVLLCYVLCECTSIYLVISSVRTSAILQKCLNATLDWEPAFVTTAVLFVGMRCWYNMCTSILLCYGALPFNEVPFICGINIFLPCFLVIYIHTATSTSPTVPENVSTSCYINYTTMICVKIYIFATFSILSACCALVLKKAAREYFHIREEQIQKHRVLQTIVTSTQDFIPLNPDYTCAICCFHCESNEENWRKLTCGHAFHNDCLVAWFKKANSCPLCRKEHT